MESNWRFNCNVLGVGDWTTALTGYWYKTVLIAELITPIVIGGVVCRWIAKVENGGTGSGFGAYLMAGMFSDYVDLYAFQVAMTGHFPYGYAVLPD